MKFGLFCLLLLATTAAHADVVCGQLQSDPDGFSLTSTNGITTHVGRETFLKTDGATRDLLLTASRSQKRVCLSATLVQMDRRNVMAREILAAKPD